MVLGEAANPRQLKGRLSLPRSRSEPTGPYLNRFVPGRILSRQRHSHPNPLGANAVSVRLRRGEPGAQRIRTLDRRPRCWLALAKHRVAGKASARANGVKRMIIDQSQPGARERTGAGIQGRIASPWIPLKRAFAGSGHRIELTPFQIPVITYVRWCVRSRPQTQTHVHGGHRRAREIDPRIGELEDVYPSPSTTSKPVVSENLSVHVAPRRAMRTS